MPITDADGDVYTLIGVTVDFNTRIMVATLSVMANGGHPEPAALQVELEGDTLDAFLDTVPGAGLSRRADFTSAIYTYCVDNVLPNGTIS